MQNSQRNGQGFGLSDMLMGALRQGMQQGMQRGQTPMDGMQGNLMGALGGLGGLGGLGSLGDLLNPGQAQRRSSQGGLSSANALGGLLGTLFGGTRRRRSGSMGNAGMMALGGLALQFLQKWMQQSQQSQRAQQSQRGRQSPHSHQQASYGEQTDKIRISEQYRQSAPSSAPQQSKADADAELAQAGWGQEWTQPASGSAAGTTSAPQWEDAAAPASTNAAPTHVAPTNAALDPAILLLLEAMVNAAKADGHMDDAERQNIYNGLAAFLSAADVDSLLAPMLDAPADPKAIAARVQDIEQGKDVYRLSCVAVEIDSYMERAYLDALGDALFLPPDVRAQLEAEARALQDSIQAV